MTSQAPPQCSRCGTIDRPCICERFVEAVAHFLIYRLVPLRTPRDIRVLRLDPARSLDKPLSGKLEALTLTSGKKFDALSYTWEAPLEGQQLSEGAIKIDGRAFTIGGNLEHALLRLRHKWYHRRIWIDQVCINQRDTEEKGQQMSIMDTIYANAKHVLVWLGEDTPEGDGQFMFGLGSILTAKGKGIGIRDEKATREEIVGTYLGDWTKPVELGDTFAKRRYFGSRWIIQEVLQGVDPRNHERIEVICGSKRVNWYALGAALKKAFKLGSKHCAHATYFFRNIQKCWSDALSDRYISQASGSSASYVSNVIDTLRQFARFECRDDIDRVFALMNLWPLQLRFPYKQGMSSVEAYIRVATIHAEKEEWFFDWTVSALLLPYAAYQIHRGVAGQRLNGLPSWVPDWRLPIPECHNPIRDRSNSFDAEVIRTDDACYLMLDITYCGVVSRYRDPETITESTMIKTKERTLLVTEESRALLSWAGVDVVLQDRDMLCRPFYSFVRGEPYPSGHFDNAVDEYERAVAGEIEGESESVCLVLRRISSERPIYQLAGLCPLFSGLVIDEMGVERIMIV